MQNFNVKDHQDDDDDDQGNPHYDEDDLDDLLDYEGFVVAALALNNAEDGQIDEGCMKQRDAQKSTLGARRHSVESPLICRQKK